MDEGSVLRAKGGRDNVGRKSTFFVEKTSLIAHSANGGEHSPLAHISRPQEWSEVFETADTQFVNRNVYVKQ